MHDFIWGVMSGFAAFFLFLSISFIIFQILCFITDILKKAYKKLIKNKQKEKQNSMKTMQK